MSPTALNPAITLRIDPFPLRSVAEAEGFEPSMGMNPNRISSAAP